MVKRKTRQKKKSKGRVVTKHHHALLTYFIVLALIFTISYQFGKLNEQYESKRIAANLIKEGQVDLGLEYCRNMDYKNYECFEMVIDAKNIMNEKFDKHICSEINVGKLPWWTSVQDENNALLEFRRVRDLCNK